MGRSSLYFATLNTTVSPVWPATGFGIFAVMTFGFRVLPSIYVAGFLIDYTAKTPFLTSALMAVGNLLEPAVAYFIINKISDIKNKKPSHLRNIGILIGSASGAFVAASVGNLALFQAGFVSKDNILSSFITWWISDLIGGMLVTPILLSLNRPQWITKLSQTKIIISFIFGLALTLAANFFLYFSTSGHYFIIILFYVALMAFLILPTQFAYLITTLIYSLSIYANIKQLGPFHNGNTNEGLLHTQLFFAGFDLDLVFQKELLNRTRAV